MSVEWQFLCKANNSLEANLLKGWLEAECVLVQLQREYLQGAIGDIPFIDTEIELWVPVIKLAEAKQLLIQYWAKKHENGPDWQCAHCTESNDSHFEVCWQCGMPAHE